jgi:pyroglutamyl-peptidase
VGHASSRRLTCLRSAQPFKSFHINPSHMIAARLPSILLPEKNSTSAKASGLPPIIRLIVHPTPLRVSYQVVASLVPQLLAYHDPDYIFHIGMAGGRDYYALETRAHRDGYRIRDVDGRDGYIDGEYRWKKEVRADGEFLPDVLECGWNIGDVERRWRQDLGLEEEKKEFDEPRVKMSIDAGRFLCDFIFYESLSVQWKKGRDRVGKVCFFHVPGEADEENVQKGVRVAEAAIRSVVGSWEEGKRREGRIVEREEELGESQEEERERKTGTGLLW